ncbi:putative oxidoreductase [Gordonia effusa NBRC 100432]|uniref:Putative oxidoreductase n=1 Tax=Gordonia effusa NBRC 100432 TaxID=1077974 RepID=H0R3U0_9ACTN|nr:SDR family oxidoreductase [Gordonia effusa]GAB19741.1 putative oxidoreductase [Gordonia effusa NBRC 100432]
MTSYFITGGSGFIGRRVIARILNTDPDAQIFALVRESSVSRFSELINSDRVIPVVGDLTAPRLGLDDFDSPIDHVIHLAAIYDMTADADSQQRANVEGTQRVIDFALARGAMLHHISSIAVAGDFAGVFTEDDFAKGQGFPSPYHRTKFESERLVREQPGLSWRVYRPSVVVGDSRTGEMDKVDGPYYFFGQLGLLRYVPSWLPLPMADLGRTNMVPVDYVSDAIVALLGYQPDKSGLTFHLSDPKRRSITGMYNALAPAFNGPRGRNVIPYRVTDAAMTLSRVGPLGIGRNLVAKQQGIPPIVLDTLAFRVDFIADASVAVLRGLGVELPDLTEYGHRLWTYWAANLDPARHRRIDRRGELVGKNVLITGGSSGIGKATARMCVQRGANVIIVARNDDDLAAATAKLNSTETKAGIPPGRVSSYRCDITDEHDVTALVKTVLAEHGHVDVLVNNAGRSIRRSTIHSVDRPHDYQRTMAVNYFGAVYLTLALLPHMIARQSGHVVNVTSIAVQTHGPRFGAYAASKAALEAFSDSTAAETLSSHVTFTNVRLPLTRTRMIAPTEAYGAAPGVWSADKAASRVLRGIVKRPRRISSSLGHLVDFGHHFTPRLTNRLLHQEYLLVGESQAAKG